MLSPDRDVAQEQTCVRCGGPLSPAGPKGGCLRCLLGIAFSTDGGLSSEVPPPGEAARPPRRNYEHFTLEPGPDGLPVELGAGAMATTYRARDTVLHAAVALKVIDKNVARRPAARERFLREARAAAKLRHPNIASVSHYGEEGGECYYVMELVEGETLDARVRRDGPLSPATALEIGVQVACALAAAEACGVVHRDIKPSNLMLAANPGQGSGDPFTVKVIDWGLAKAAGDDPILGADHTRDSFVGTPAFASPEQFAPPGERRVDTRSDIYSLGVTLWYLISGRTPFVGGTLEAIHTRQGKPPFEQLAARRVPAPLVGVLAAMLAPDPAARPQSARELLDQLRRCQQQTAARKNGGRRRWPVISLVTLALLAAVAGAGWRWLSPTDNPLEGSIAVLPFEDPGADDPSADFARGLHDEIARTLACAAPGRIVNVNGGRADPSRLGARFLLTGSVRREGGRVQVSVQLSEADRSRPCWGERYDRQGKDVFAVPDAVAQSVAARLGVQLTATQRAALAAPLTVDAAAYDLYVRVHYAVRGFRSETENDQYQTEVVIPSLEAVVRDNPAFVLAYCDLAAAHDALIQCEPATMQAETRAKHRLQAEVALATACRLQADSGEVHLALARHFSNISRDPAQARIELALARRELPDGAEVESLTGEIAYNQNRWEEAVRCFKRAAALDPRGLEARGSLVNLYHSLRRCGDGEEAASQIIALRPDDSLSARLDRTMYRLEARADLAPLQAAVSALTPSGQPQVEVMDRYRLLLSILTRDPGGITRALDHMGPSHIRIRGVSYPKHWFTALAARLRGDAECARCAFIQARGAARYTSEIEPMNGRALGLLAMIDAGLGDRDKAVLEARHASELCTVDTAADQAPIVACDLAVVYAWTGQPELACAVLDEWSQRPAGFGLPRQPTYGDLKLNPLWDDLRDRPEFISVMARLAPSAREK